MSLLNLGWDIISMIIVGAFWGCTNPLLRRGAVEVSAGGKNNKNSNSSTIMSVLRQFLNIKVWLPYILNQCGSILFYVLLSKSDLSLAVPTCNALALVFTCITSVILGEPLYYPYRTILGSALVVGGVAVCVLSSSQEENENDAADGASSSTLATIKQEL